MSSWFEDETFRESLDWFLFSQIRTDEMTSVEADQIMNSCSPHQPQRSSICVVGQAGIVLNLPVAGFVQQAWIERPGIWSWRGRVPRTKAWTSNFFKQT